MPLVNFPAEGNDLGAIDLIQWKLLPHRKKRRLLARLGAEHFIQLCRLAEKASIVHSHCFDNSAFYRHTGNKENKKKRKSYLASRHGPKFKPNLRWMIIG